ncbi:MAG: hypothetical protein SWO11_00525 [Thermodesulfobacteriota bacterium]|nr:hypothetical protein [Thermodesulfobacteriota bacterium]
MKIFELFRKEVSETVNKSDLEKLRQLLPGLLALRRSWLSPGGWIRK